MEMGNTVLALVLLSALMNAGWNSAIKLGGDKLVVMGLTTAIASVLSLLVLPWLDVSVLRHWPASVWWLLLASIAIHTLYHFALPLAYQHGDFGMVYPVARGSAPLFVTVAAGLFIGEWPGVGGLWGVACLSLGVLALSLRTGLARHGRQWQGGLYALAAGLLIATYTVIDGLGARAAGSALVFAAMLTAADGLLTVLIVARLRGRAAMRVDRRSLRLCLLAAAMQITASWLATWALSQAPMALVSALRESSVLFAGLIAMVLMHERWGWVRALASVLVFAGIVLVRLGA